MESNEPTVPAVVRELCAMLKKLGCRPVVDPQYPKCLCCNRTRDTRMGVCWECDNSKDRHIRKKRKKAIATYIRQTRR